MRGDRAVLAAVLSLLCLLTACSEESPETDPGGDGVVRFASYDFPENQILAELYAEAARRSGVDVSVQHGIGTREVVFPALQQGVVDVVVDYVGTATAFARPGTTRQERTPAELHAALRLTLGARRISVLTPAQAEDQNGFAVTTAFAAHNDVGRLSDLAPLAHELVFGGPPECPDRPFCLQGLEDVYGLRFGAVRNMPSRAATVEALLAGDIDVGLLETTDARLAVSPVMLLVDDRELQPPENVVPLVRTAVLTPELEGALERVSEHLTTGDLMQLNRVVEVEGLSPAEAAARWWASVA